MDKDFAISTEMFGIKYSPFSIVNCESVCCWQTCRTCSSIWLSKDIAKS